MARAWVGTSGFNYQHWRGDFYPEGLPERAWFAHYVRHFHSVELNVTFYRLPPRASFEGWARTAPRDFAFVLKGSRYVTHVKRLRVGRGEVAVIFERAEPLGERLACVIWQLPPRWTADDEDVDRLRAFLETVGSVEVAAETRHALEFRDPSWFRPEVLEAVREAGWEVVLADAPFQVLPPGKRRRGRREVVRGPEPARWAYLRRHGPRGLYRGNYPAHHIRADAAWARGWLAEGKDVFAFYNNDVGGHAVRNARSLARALGAAAGAPAGEASAASARRSAAAMS